MAQTLFSASGSLGNLVTLLPGCPMAKLWVLLLKLREAKGRRGTSDSQEPGLVLVLCGIGVTSASCDGVPPLPTASLKTLQLWLSDTYLSYRVSWFLLIRLEESLPRDTGRLFSVRATSGLKETNVILELFVPLSEKVLPSVLFPDRSFSHNLPF